MVLKKDGKVLWKGGVFRVESQSLNPPNSGGEACPIVRGLKFKGTTSPKEEVIRKLTGGRGTSGDSGGHQRKRMFP